MGTRILAFGENINATAQEIIVITVYEPDPAQWDASFRTRLTP
jgi:hypothetical protein